MNKRRLKYRFISVFFIPLCIIVFAGNVFAESSVKYDYFWSIGEMNKASLVMLQEKGIIAKPLAAEIAKAIDKVITEGNKPGGERPMDYLEIEALITKVGGKEISRVHSGRSRQDMQSTSERMFLRKSLITSYESLNGMRDKLIALASKHVDTIVPAYSHGVQSQPTTFGHYLLGWAESFDRDAARLREVYIRLNESPLGSAAGVTSSFDVDRNRLAQLLGFDGLVENALDAVYFSPASTHSEYASALSISALSIGNIAQDIHVQYHVPHPWITIKAGPPLTGISSIMPQKRNPRALENVRSIADSVIGGTQTVLLQAHNSNSYMHDFRYSLMARNVAVDAQNMYTLFGQTLDSLYVDKDRALAEVDADYSTTSELADKLQQIANVPFRIGHHFASQMVDYGRERNLKPTDIPYGEAQRLYKKDTGQDLPLTEVQFKDALSASHMISASKGIGGPQLSEVKRMLDNELKRLNNDVNWVNDQKTKLNDAETKLQRDFSKLVTMAK